MKTVTFLMHALRDIRLVVENLGIGELARDGSEADKAFIREQTELLERVKDSFTRYVLARKAIKHKV